MKQVRITGLSRAVIVVAAAGAAVACSATEAQIAGRGFADTSYDAAERTRTQFDVAAARTAITDRDASVEEAERIKARFHIPAVPDTSYDAIEKLRVGR